MGTAERREREKEHRRNEIIDAAEKVFFAKGMPNATMGEVADEAELSKGTLYLYFKNKEDLYLAIILRGLAILEENFKEAVASREDGLGKTEAIGRAFFSFCNTHPDYFQAMLHFEASAEPAQDCAHAGYAAECQIQTLRIMEICSGAVQAGINDGTLRSDLDPMKTAMTLYGMSVGLLQIVCMKRNTLEEEHKIDPGELIEYFFEFVMHSLEAPERESHAWRITRQMSSVNVVFRRLGPRSSERERPGRHRWRSRKRTPEAPFLALGAPVPVRQNRAPISEPQGTPLAAGASCG